MARLTDSELNFLVRFRLMTLSKSILQQLQKGGPARDVALDMATDHVCAGFERHEVIAPEPQPSPLEAIGNGARRD